MVIGKKCLYRGGGEGGGRRYMDKVMICFHFLWGPFPNLNHVVKLGIIRTDVGQTFPICLTFHYNNVEYSWFLYFLSLKKTWNIKFCLWCLKLIREDNNLLTLDYIWLLPTICGWSRQSCLWQKPRGWPWDQKNCVGQTSPICFTMLNIQHFCIFWILTKPDVFQTLPICLNVRHNVQYSLQFQISWVLPHNTWCFAEATILFCVFFPYLKHLL